MENNEAGQTKNYAIVLLGILGVILSLQQAWVPGFFADGYLYAVFGKNAALNGHWLIPHVNEALYPEFHHHTPFLFMIEGLFFKAFGATFVSARVFSALFYLLTAFLLYTYLKRKTPIKPYFPLLLFLTIPPLFKKVRFPNMDIALMLSMFGAFLFYRLMHKTGKTKYAYLLGAMFGISLLIKGPVGLLIPLAIIFDLMVQKKLSFLKNIHAWAGLIFGLLLFCLWPLLLNLNGRMDIFHQWYDFTFIHTIKDGRGVGEPWYTYILFLLKSAPVWFLLALMGTRFAKRSEFMTSATTFFYVILIFFSIPKFKYSNYLIPMYPYMGLMAGFFLNQTLSQKVETRTKAVFNLLIPIAGLVLLIFPLTTEIRRDEEIFALKKSFSYQGISPERWTIVKEAYPYYALASLNEWVDGTPTYQQANAESANCIDCVFIVKNEILNEFQQLNPTFSAYAIFERYGSTVMVPSSYLIRTLNLK